MVSPYGAHQAGVETPAPAVVQVEAFDLLPTVDRSGLARLMRVWSQDLEAMTQGWPVPGDQARDLLADPSSLTVTIGFGPRVFELPGLAPARPAGFVALPALRQDRLEPRWSGGDLVVQVCGDDALTVSHALRRLRADAAVFVRPRWRQSGFWRANGVGQGGTGRNLMGQVDGTGNASPGSELFGQVVWAGSGSGVPDWFQGGTMMVVRRIQMLLDTWDRLTKERQEAVIGRRLADGAPLGSARERDPLPLLAKDFQGRPVIPVDAHARLANPESNSGRRIYRRAANYDDGVNAVGEPDSGLLFIAFQASIADQFVPIQRGLERSDALNAWTVPIGSAVFVVPPGFESGGWVGRSLLG
jgi:dye decolorizing peroxidase